MPVLTQQPAASFLERRILNPLRDLLLTGITPRRLAWSLTLGILLGINPLLGSATLLTFTLALALRLNVVAAQFANYLVYPLQLAFLLVFLRAGSRLFHDGPIPFTRADLIRLAHHPLATAHRLGRWEAHALVVWLLIAASAAPILAVALTPALRRLLNSLEQPAA